MQFIAPAPEFRNNIFRQKLCIAAGNIDIYIGHPHKAIEDRFKISQKLHLVEKDIVHSMIGDLIFYVGIENIRVPILFVFVGIKGHIDNVICRHTCFKQIIPEDRKQQIRFAAAAHSGNHLNESIVLLADQFFQVIITPNFQCPRLHRKFLHIFL